MIVEPAKVVLAVALDVGRIRCAPVPAISCIAQQMKRGSTKWIASSRNGRRAAGVFDGGHLVHVACSPRDRLVARREWQTSPIEDRPAPTADIPGEVASPTQPFPTKPAPFARQSFTEKDINPYLPAAERAALETMLDASGNRVRHTPTTRLRDAAADQSLEGPAFNELAAVIDRLFALGEELAPDSGEESVTMRG